MTGLVHISLRKMVVVSDYGCAGVPDITGVHIGYRGITMVITGDGILYHPEYIYNMEFRLCVKLQMQNMTAGYLLTKKDFTKKIDNTKIVDVKQTQ